MFTCITWKRVSAILMALGFGLGLGGCAAETGDAATADEGSLGEVSAPLPLAAFSAAGADFGTAALGTGFGTALGTGAGTGTIGTSLGTGSSFNTGPVGFSTSTGTGPVGFSTGPIGSSTSFNSGPMGFSTGPIGSSTSFNSGPIGFSTGPIRNGGTTSVSMASGQAPVVSNCLGPDCL